jgi:hypothetical protein
VAQPPEPEAVRAPSDVPDEPLWDFRLTTGLAARLAPLGLLLFVASIVAYAILARQPLNSAPIPSPLIIVLAVLLVFVVHEALHGVGYLMFGGRPRFGAGIKGAAPYLYATCPGKRFGWGQFLVIGTLPLVVIDVIAVALAWYSPFAVIGMLAFAFNTAGAVGDLWIIAVILQTPRSASFESTNTPSIVAWPRPGARMPTRRPRGLDPRGFESFVIWPYVALALFIGLVFVISLLEVEIARASSNGRLAVGNVELALATTIKGHFSARVSAPPLLLSAAVLTVALTLAARAVVGRVRKGRDRARLARL